MVIENATAAVGAIPSLMNWVQALVGGIFGLYLILVILRIYETKRLLKVMRDIRYDVRKVAEKIGVKETSESKKSKIVEKIKGYRNKK